MLSLVRGGGRAQRRRAAQLGRPGDVAALFRRLQGRFVVGPVGAPSRTRGTGGGASRLQLQVQVQYKSPRLGSWVLPGLVGRQGKEG
jgi:hypothetical protein